MIGDSREQDATGGVCSRGQDDRGGQRVTGISGRQAVTWGTVAGREWQGDNGGQIVAGGQCQGDK